MRGDDQKTFDLFLSFASLDRRRMIDGKRVDVVEEFKRALERHEIEFGVGGRKRRFRVCTFDEDFSLRPELRSAMESAIANSGAFLVLCSSHSKGNPNVVLELEIHALLHPAQPPRSAVIDLAPNTAFPEHFAPGALGADLSIAPTTVPREWRARMTLESHKVVAAVTGKDPREVHDRFESDERRRRTREKRWVAALIAVVLVAWLWAQSSVGYHLVRTFRFDDGDLGNDGFLGFDGEESFWTTHERHLHQWSTASDAPLETIPIQGFSSRACLAPDGKAWVASGRDLLRVDLREGSRTSVFRAPGFIQELACDGNRVAITALGALYVSLDGEHFAEGPRPEAPHGRHSPKEFQEVQRIHWGERLAWQPSGPWLACSSFTGRLILVDPSSWTFRDPQNPILYEVEDTRPIERMAFAPDGERLVFTEGSKRLVVLSVDEMKFEPFELPVLGVVNILLLDPDESRVVIATPQGVHWIERRDGLYVLDQRVQADPFDVTGMSFSPDHEFLVVCGYQNHLTAYSRTLRIGAFDVPWW